MSKTVVVLRCEHGSKTLEILPVATYLERLRDPRYKVKSVLVEAKAPVDLDTFEGEIVIEGDLVVPTSHPELNR